MISLEQVDIIRRAIDSEQPERISQLSQKVQQLLGVSRRESGDEFFLRATEAEEELAKIYSLLEISPNPIGKVKSQVHPKAPPKNPPPENQGDT